VKEPVPTLTTMSPVGILVLPVITIPGSSPAVLETVTVVLVVVQLAPDSITMSPSVTVSVMVEEPLELEAGVIVSVRLAPPPPIARFDTGNSAGLDDVAETSSDPAGVPLSPTVNGIADDAFVPVVLWFETVEMVGALLEDCTTNVVCAARP